MTDSENNKKVQSVRFEQVLRDELKYFGCWKEPVSHSPSTSAEKGKQATDDTQRNNARPSSSHDEDLTCSTEDAQYVISVAHRAGRSGLAFSGGGIRSATFNLGVLQALARLKLLDQFDYLSTVSGGGYIGSWFSAWVHRTHSDKSNNTQRSEKQEDNESPDEESPDEKCCSGLKEVSDELTYSVSAAEDPRPRAAMQPDPSPIWHLREYANYLSPRTGLWSTDSWTLGVTYIRNLGLTLSLLLAMLVTLVLLTRIVTLVYFNVASVQEEAVYFNIASPDTVSTAGYLLVPALFCVAIFLATLFTGIELGGGDTRKTRKLGMSRYTISRLAVTATMAAAVTGSLWLWHVYTVPPEQYIAAIISNLSWCVKPGANELNTLCQFFSPGMLISLAVIPGWLLGVFIGRAGGGKRVSTGIGKWLWLMIITPAVSIAVFFTLLKLTGQWMAGWGWEALGNPLWSAGYWNIVVWGTPLMVCIFSVAALVMVGVNGSALDEHGREWLARFFALLSKWTILITVWIILVLYSPLLIQLLGEHIDGLLNPGLTTVWGSLSAAGAYIARNVMIGKSSDKNRGIRILLVTAPYVFILGMIIITVWLTDSALIWWHSLDDSKVHLATENYWYYISHIDLQTLVVASIASITFMLIWSFRIGVNRFSLHSMYAGRLIRAYLGASNVDRKAHAFTGFDDDDNNIRMHDLCKLPDACTCHHNSQCNKPPYLIINAAINLVSSKRLAWQKRKAASFTFTPKYCGYEYCGDSDSPTAGNHGDQFVRIGGFVKSQQYAGDANGVSLGKAMTISGAAASPNMGYHSSPALTFLMTTFNVRLGWWLPNTVNKRKWIMASSNPHIGLLYLLKELLGRTNARSDYVYLSDGGHFENLGIYELVRRRCHIIVACDAEADPGMSFAGLGNAIEKCQIDLGVPIDIDVSQIKPDPETGTSEWHCAVGCIRYSEADNGQPDGTLVYIKSSLSGDEPLSVDTYASSHKGFPHESTADQWFDETQFESYRALGEHIAQSVLENFVNVANSIKDDGQRTLDRLIVELRKRWYAGTHAHGKEPADHDALLESIVDTLRTDTSLSYLDGQLYPNLKNVADSHFPDNNNLALPADYKEFRAGFYFCKRLIQFMQQVYYDRKLDHEYAAPRNRGWMNLFRRWSWSRMLRFTWVMTAGTYGARFQSFCEHRLSLDTGRPEIDEQALEIMVYKSEKTDMDSTRKEAGDSAAETIDYDIKFLDIYGHEIEWKKVKHNFGIHYYETHLIRQFINAYIKEDSMKDHPNLVTFHVYPLKLVSADPLAPSADKSIKLNAGFLITGPATISKDKTTEASPGNTGSASDKTTYSSRVLYFRIRPSMRNMDLSRKAFQACAKRNELKKWQLIDLKITEDASRYRGYRDVYFLDKSSMNRCHWYAKMLDENMQSDIKDEKDQRPGSQTQ